ncbi:hypothetical protein [Nocardiopsis xinjiangensis]|uniref:hypothetical protein n=1 Tax=Nocardiopsis xinjiangensis TaxID=124285 RepID=UPI00034B0994|nr:hypothetical protein [Nocardiopsis xinjiangensis]
MSPERDPVHPRDLDALRYRINRIEARLALRHEVERASRAVTAGLSAGAAVLFQSLYLVWEPSGETSWSRSTLSGWEMLFTGVVSGTVFTGIGLLALLALVATALVAQRQWAFRAVLGAAAAFPVLWLLGWALAHVDTEGAVEAGPGPWCALAGVALIAASAARAERLWRDAPRGWE